MLWCLLWKDWVYADNLLEDRLALLTQNGKIAVANDEEAVHVGTLRTALTKHEMDTCH